MRHNDQRFQVNIGTRNRLGKDNGQTSPANIKQTKDQKKVPTLAVRSSPTYISVHSKKREIRKGKIRKTGGKKGEIRKEREIRKAGGAREVGTEKGRKGKRVAREREAEREKRKKGELRGRSRCHCGPRSRRRRSAAILTPVAAAVGDEARRRHSRLYRRQNYTLSLKLERRCNHRMLSSLAPPPFKSRTGERARRKPSRSYRRRHVDGLAIVLLARLLGCRSSSPPLLALENRSCSRQRTPLQLPNPIPLQFGFRLWFIYAGFCSPECRSRHFLVSFFAAG
ncbi:uncharacterized protein LOC130974643 [Arachis stenosperma]|uniref:uncharacterized protein LOC130974643 n=1 Tax=Arachis stenosperma TaxID=217475 RepID=UPI0025AB9400|nr:uncharacterized protein LOC130974643 [Arachis stenosperma]